MQANIREVGIYMSAFADEVLADSLQRLLPFVIRRRSPPNQFVCAIAASAAAHGAEILMKSAIAREHPLLLFETKPNARRIPNDDQLELEHLFERETIQFSSLPYALWAATGYKVADADSFDAFRLLRNKIEHFSTPPNEIILDRTIRFLFSVVDPMLRRFWENDLLSLIRPHGVHEYLAYVQSLGISYSPPDWIIKFDPKDEKDELEQVRAMAESHWQRAKQVSEQVTEWFLQMSLIVPARQVELARREVIRITGNPAENQTFSVPLSPTGESPATHLGAHTSATEDIAVRHIRLMKRLGGYYNFTSVRTGDVDQARATFDDLCTALGLTRLKPAHQGVP